MARGPKSDVDHVRWTKGGFAVGIALIVIGFGGDIALEAAGVAVPGPLATMFVWSQMLGILVALLAPLVFGIILPLLE